MAPQNALSMNIRRLRTARGLTQTAAADAAGLSRQAFVDIENGKTKEPRVSNLQAIAGALDVPLTDLFTEAPALHTVRFRISSTQTKKQLALREQHLIDAAFWLRDFCYLQSVLGDHKDYLLQPVRDQVPEHARDPRRAAQLARGALGLKDHEPIGDIAGLMENAGIKIRTLPFQLENFFGFSVSEPDGGPAIIVNTSNAVTTERQIFTVAHELGHLLLHPSAYDPQQTKENTNEEKEADSFAAYFLMPDSAFKQKNDDAYGLPFYDRVLFIKCYFGVSYRSVLRRFAETGVAPYNKLLPKFLAIHTAKTGAHLTNRQEPFPLAPYDFIEDYLRTLVRKAIDQAQITVNKAAQILHLPLSGMRDLINSWADVPA